MLESIWTGNSHLVVAAATCVLSVISTLWITEKWKDKSKRKASRQEFQALYDQMPAFIGSLQEQLRKTPLKWDFHIMGKDDSAQRPQGVSVYLTDGSDDLVVQVKHLINRRYVDNIDLPFHSYHYRMSEAFVTLLQDNDSTNG